MKQENQDFIPQRLKRNNHLSEGLSPSIPHILPMGHTNGMINKPSPNNSNSVQQQQPAANHRPVTSCSHCRQHKIKCDAHQNFPSPCSRCTKYGLHCEVDPQFKPKKGSQLQLMRRDLDDLKIKVNYLINNENILLKHINEINPINKDILINKNFNHFDTPRDLTTQTEGSIMSPYQTTLDQSHTPHTQFNGLNNTTNNTNHNTNNNIPIPNNVISNGLNSKVGNNNNAPNQSTKISVQTYLVTEPALLNKNNNVDDLKRTNSNISNVSTIHSKTSKHDPENSLPNTLQLALQRGAQTDENVIAQVKSNSTDPQKIMTNNNGNNIDAIKNNKKSPVILTTETLNPLPSPYNNIDEFVLGDVHISIHTATRLHTTFVHDYLPYFPIMYTNSVTELYSQSQLLFWTIMLTACLSDPEPTLYNKLSVVIKQLAIETCWMRTPRSTHITQALLILCIWPLPNQKVLDDCSYRFVGLAKSLSYQLGLHRDEFITEFTRSQTSMPNAEKWRSRTWLGIYFAELCWASILGLPPTSKTDYLVENALQCKVEEDAVEPVSSKSSTTEKPVENADNESRMHLPSRFKKMISLSHFQLKLCNVMGSSVTSPDGLIGPKERAGVLSVLNKELDDLANVSNFETSTDVNIYYLYVRLMVYCFAFFPETPIEDQAKYITDSYLCATKIVTLLTKLLEIHQLISLPIFIRQSATFSALILFKLQLTPLLPSQYLNSARQSIVTVHRLFRNQLTAWATVENDISRTASMLEKLNLVSITHSEVFVEESGVISRMRSHLTGSLFYDLVWCVHEARRREMDPKYNEAAIKKAKEKRRLRSKNKNKNDNIDWDKKLYPLPLYNHITRDDFKTITQTTPGGTTVTTLVPTKTALKHAEELAKTNDKKDSAIEINGIPLFMLDETGSVKIDDVLAQNNMGMVASHLANSNKHDHYSDMGDSSHGSQPNTTLGTPNSDYGTYYHGSTHSTNGPSTKMSYGSNRSASNTGSLFSSNGTSIPATNISQYTGGSIEQANKNQAYNNTTFRGQPDTNSNNLNSYLNSNKKKHSSQQGNSPQANNGKGRNNAGSKTHSSKKNGNTNIIILVVIIILKIKIIIIMMYFLIL